MPDFTNLPPDMDIVAFALREDIGDGDVTSVYFTDPVRTTRAVIVARETCILAGIDVAAEVFRRVDSELQIKILRQNGDRLECGEAALEIFGRAASLLTGERTALNFAQRLSGVATLTRHYIEAIAGTSTVLLDTRKTTPGLRKLEKGAVLAGGATNHRFGLFDMVMVKDNHLAAMPDDALLIQAIDRVRRERPGIRIELEADSLDQARRFAAMEGVDVILLDNMTPEQVCQALTLRKPGLKFEASGDINLKNIRKFAITGVDYISVGKLTHSARAVNLSLDFCE